jgi:hypothetical protein
MNTEQEPMPASGTQANPYATPRAALVDTPPPGPSPRLRFWFLRSFWTSFVLGFLTLSVLFGGQSIEVFLLSFFATLVTVIVHLTTLALVASSSGRNPLLWLAAAILFAPFGYFIAYSRLTSLIEPDEAPGESDTRETSNQ